MRKHTAIRAGSRAALAALVLLFGTVAHAAIPAGERNVLLGLYTATNGAGWTTATGWNGAGGTECSWYGITCNPGGTSVIGIDLSGNKLTGSLPALSGLPQLREFVVYGNQLAGAIPALAGLPDLRIVNVSGNSLSGAIPSLAGVTKLANFIAGGNQLTGPIPPLVGLTHLSAFEVGQNQLTGSIPPLAGLTALDTFDAAGNHLTGPIPSLAGLTGLIGFFVQSNQLTGSIPALTGLTNLSRFAVSSNQLSGEVPAVPSPNALLAGNSSLCPNALNLTPNAAWDAATASTPWYLGCSGDAIPIAAKVTDLWWDPSESGWGMQLVNTGTFVFATVYVYDQAGHPIWLTGTLSRTSIGPLTFAGNLVVTTGPYFAGPFDPANVTRRVAGTMTFVLTSATSGQLTYSVDGAVVNKSVQRQPLTLDDYSGAYLATATLTRAGCLGAGNDGTDTLQVSIQIAHNGESMSAAWTDSGGNVCTHTGTYSQLGRIGTFVGGYTCTSGDAGSATYSEMTNGLGTFRARLTANSTTLGCTTAGRVSGLIPN